MEFHNRQILPPKNWEEFESLCLDLFRLVWKDPLAQKNGRQGQPQCGTDISGNPASAPQQTHAVQCKGKSIAYGAAVTLQELKDEIEKAKKFKPPLSHWVLATTAPKDSAIEEQARLITEQHRALGLFAVKVLGWEDLQSLIGDHPEVMEKHYRDQAPTTRRTLELLEDLNAKSATPEIIQLLVGLQTGMDALLGRASADPGAGQPLDPADIALQARIDEARDQLRSGKARTALSMLTNLREKYWESASDRAKFRILTNQGAANSELGEFSQAADLALEADKYANGDPLSAINVIRARLFRDEKEKARKVADAALADHKNNAQLAGLRVLASLDEPGVVDPLSTVDTSLQTSAAVLTAAAVWHRHQNDDAKALELLEKAHEADSADIPIRGDLGTALLVRGFGTEPPILGRRFNAREKADIDRGIDLLKGVWDTLRSRDASPHHAPVAVNLISAYRTLGRIEDAERVADAALALWPEEPNLVAHKAHLLLWRARPDEALTLLGRITSSSHDDTMLRIEALDLAGRKQEALEALNKVAESSTSPHRRLAGLERVRVLWEQGQRQEATAAAQKLVEEEPDDPAAYIALSNIKRFEGDLAAAQDASAKALIVLNPNDAVNRLFVADALYSNEQWDAAADLLGPITATDRDSQSLRRLVRSLFRADRRQEALSLLSALTPAVAQLPVYLHAAALLHDRVGNLREAREHFERYLEQRPSDLDARLRWLDIVEDLGDRETRDNFLDGSIDTSTASPESRMALAQTLDKYGRSPRAYELAYQTLRRNWDRPRVHLGYTGLMFLGKDGDAAIARMDKVAIDTGFTVKDEHEELIYYTIEPSSPQLPSLGEIAPESRLATRALGLGVGSQLRVHDTPTAKDAQIIEVQHKYLQLFHRSLRDFNALFPEETGLFRVRIDGNKPEESLESFREVAERRRQSVRTVLDIYRTAPVPLAMVAQRTGDNVVDAWYGLMQLDVPFDVCAGNEPERRQALALLRRRPKLILDPLTLWIAGVLGVLPVLDRTFGKLGITQSTIDVLQKCRYERALHADKEGGSVTSQGGDKGVAIIPRSAEQSAAALGIADTILNWARENGTIIPAIPPKDFASSVRQLGEGMDASFLDTIAAGQASNRMLLSDDRRFRAAAREIANVPGAWLQAALIVAAESGLMDRDKYVEATANLALAGHNFTTVDGDVLLLVAQRNKWRSNGEFRRLVNLLGGPDVDLQSSFNASSAFLRTLWERRDVAKGDKEDLTEALFDAIALSDEPERVELTARLAKDARPGRAAFPKFPQWLDATNALSKVAAAWLRKRRAR